MDLLLVLIIVLVVALMWRGPKNLPKIGQALGRGVKEARHEATKVQEEIQTRVSTDPADRGSTPATTSAAPVAPVAPVEDPLTASAPGNDGRA